MVDGAPPNAPNNGPRRVKFTRRPPHICPDCYWKGAFENMKKKADEMIRKFNDLMGHHLKLRLELMKKIRPPKRTVARGELPPPIESGRVDLEAEEMAESIDRTLDDD
jgi:hypothetical protein